MIACEQLHLRASLFVRSTNGPYESPIECLVSRNITNSSMRSASSEDELARLRGKLKMAWDVASSPVVLLDRYTSIIVSPPKAGT